MQRFVLKWQQRLHYENIFTLKEADKEGLWRFFCFADMSFALVPTGFGKNIFQKCRLPLETWITRPPECSTDSMYSPQTKVEEVESLTPTKRHKLLPLYPCLELSVQGCLNLVV